MSEMSFEAAEQALQAAGSAEFGASPSEAGSPEVDAGATPAATQPADSFTNIDPNTLSPELQSIYRNMQGDYTRKTQEIAPLAELRKEFGDDFDPDRLRQSVQFIDALETDAEFAQAVYNQLENVLSQAGLLETGATQPAADASLGEDAYVDPESAMAQQIQELQAWKDQQEQFAQEQALAGYIQRQEMSLRQEFPDWTDDDVNSVYEISFAHGGDLFSAAKSYSALKDRFVSAYLDQKTQVPSGVNAVTGGGFSQAPAEGFGSDLDAAHRAAVEHLRNSLSD